MTPTGPAPSWRARPWPPMAGMRLDAGAVREALKSRVSEVAEALLGEPNRAASSRRDLRFGRHGSLSIATAGERAGLWRDHEAGTGGDMLALVQRETGGDFPAALQWAADFLGIDGAPTPPGGKAFQSKIATDRTAPINAKPTAAATDDDADRTRQALTIWRDGVGLKDTLAEVYLRTARGIDWPDNPWPDDLRFHPRLRLVGDRPALVALIRDLHTGAPKAVQATAIKPDGSGRERDERGRMSKGPTKHGAIMLTPFDEITLGLGLAEGLETALSVFVFGWPVWATIGTSGLASFPVLAGIETLTIWGDNDAGKDRNAGLEAAKVCGVRWRDAGIEAAIRYPKRGGDWNDAIKARAAA